MTTPAIRTVDLGVRFRLQHTPAPTVRAGLRRFIRGRQRSKEFWALRHVNLEVPHGAILGVIGANGSGKSTLLRVLSRILPPDEGFLEVDGKVSSLITLGAGFHSNLSGYDNIYYNGILMGLSRAEVDRKIDEIIGFTELGDRIYTPVATYSSGMKARLGFSIAVHIDPDIVLIDEVIAVGDAQFRDRSLEKMQELFERGSTVVMVLHNMKTIIDMCDRVLWLDKGAPQKMGEPTEVVNAYLASRGLPPVDQLRPKQLRRLEREERRASRQR